MMFSYLTVLASLLAIYPIVLAIKLLKENKFIKISLLITIVMTLITIEGIGQLGLIIDHQMLAAISIVSGNYMVVLCWYIIIFVSIFFSQDALRYIRRVINYNNMLETKVTEIEAVQKITKILASPVLSLKEKLQKVLEISIKQVSADRGSIMLKNEAGDLEIMAATDENLIGIKTPADHSISGLVVRESKTLNIEDIKLDSRFKKDYMDRYKKDSFLSIPIKIREEVMGVLNISDKQVEEIFSRHDEDILLNFIDKICSFIENAELYELLEEERSNIETQLTINNKLIETVNKQNKELENTNRRLNSICDITEKIMGLTTLDNIISVIATSFKEDMEIKKWALVFNDDTSNDLEVINHDGLHYNIKDGSKKKGFLDVCHYVLDTNESLLVSDIEEDFRFKGLNEGDNTLTKSFAAIPLKRNNKTFGILVLTQKISGKHFTEDDINIFKTMCRQISLAILSIKKYEKLEHLKNVKSNFDSVIKKEPNTSMSAILEFCQKLENLENNKLGSDYINKIKSDICNLYNCGLSLSEGLDIIFVTLNSDINKETFKIQAITKPK